MPNNYVDDEKLTNEVIKWQKLNKEKPTKMNDYIGKCILDLANGLASRPNFINYSYKDEMKNHGIEHVIRYLKNFKHEVKGKDGKVVKYTAYTYINYILTNCYIQIINKEHYQAYLRDLALVSNANFDPDNAGGVYEDAIARIAEYEEKQKHKKEKSESRRKERELIKKKSNIYSFMDMEDF